MQMFIAIVAVCSLAVVSAQDSTTGVKCPGIKSYIAASFNAVRFTVSTSYHDNKNFKTLYEDDEGDSWALYDLNQGKLFRYDGSTCSFYYNKDAVMTPQDMRNKMVLDWQLPDFNGSPVTGYSVQNGEITLRGVLRDDCVESYSYIAVRGLTATAAFHAEFQTENVEQTIADKISAAEAIVAQGCGEFDLPKAFN